MNRMTAKQYRAIDPNGHFQISGQLVKPRAKPKKLETIQQINFVRWFECTFPQFLLHHSPNQLPRVRGEDYKESAYRKMGGLLKMMGTKAGWPDIQIMEERRGFKSLFIEMKQGSGKPSDNQKKMHEALRSRGNLVVICNSCEEAQMEVISYFDLAKDVCFMRVQQLVLKKN